VSTRLVGLRAAFRLSGHGLAAAATLVLTSSACGDGRPVEPDSGGSEEFEWNLPPGFPKPRVPADNPMTEEKVQLGRHLFHDKRMSGNLTMSCASCHWPSLAFADSKTLPVGSMEEVLPRNSMGLTNVAYAPVLTWADHWQTELTEQVLIPLFAQDPVELGLEGPEMLLDRLRADSTYRSLFAEAYSDDEDPFTLDNVTKAIASFERVMISGNSPEDRFRRGDTDALTDEAKEGRALFFSNTVGCFRCHSGTNEQGEVIFFTTNFDYEGRSQASIRFENNGLYNLTVNGEQGWYPEPSTGLYAITGNPTDRGRFKVPDLRNVSMTWPYMHDGSLHSLTYVIDHYQLGGRNIEAGPFVGDGRANPYKSPLIRPFDLSPQQELALMRYLSALTDHEFITNPRFWNPWPEDSPAHGVR
jgi:cytochrome c peroxidase